MRGNEGSKERGMREVQELMWTVERGQVSMYLRGNVVRGAAEGACGVSLKHALPAHPEVCYLYVALAVKQHIIQL